MKNVFLTADWRNLAMINYEVDPRQLAKHVPRGTELDFWEGKTFVSIVGFLFLNTKVLGIPIPFHRNFEEVNLRFYVRRDGPSGPKRGVCFIKEIVPKIAIAATARYLYNENYIAAPMSHQITGEDEISLQYGWLHSGNDYSINLKTIGSKSPAQVDSEEHFITEHYWGYSKQRNGGTIEYEVSHTPWNVWQTESVTMTGDFAKLYGEEFREVFSRAPSSTFLADGSAIAVSKGKRIN